MNSSTAAATTSYIGQLAVVAMWLDGAIESGNWHLTYEVVTVSLTLTAQTALHLKPLWSAILKKIFGYDPYANGEAKP